MCVCVCLMNLGVFCLLSFDLICAMCFTVNGQMYLTIIFCIDRNIANSSLASKVGKKKLFPAAPHQKKDLFCPSRSSHSRLIRHPAAAFQNQPWRGKLQRWRQIWKLGFQKYWPPSLQHKRLWSKTCWRIIRVDWTTPGEWPEIQLLVLVALLVNHPCHWVRSQVIYSPRLTLKRKMNPHLTLLVYNLPCHVWANIFWLKS